MVVIVTGTRIPDGITAIVKHAATSRGIEGQSSRTVMYPESAGPAKRVAERTAKMVTQAIDNEDFLVLVTYSEDVICIVGHMIHAGQIDCKDIGIDIYFEDGEYEGDEIITSGYDEEGVLDENWAFGLLTFDREDIDNGIEQARKTKGKKDNA